MIRTVCQGAGQIDSEVFNVLFFFLLLWDLFFLDYSQDHYSQEKIVNLHLHLFRFGISLFCADTANMYIGVWGSESLSTPPVESW